MDLDGVVMAPTPFPPSAGEVRGRRVQVALFVSLREFWACGGWWRRQGRALMMMEVEVEMEVDGWMDVRQT